MYNTNSSNSVTAAWQKLRAAARKDPKKAGVLAVLAVVMAGAWAKTLLQPQPASAGAATLPGAGNDSAAGRGAGSDKPAAKPVASSPWAVVGLTPAARNLFRVDYERYERFGRSKETATTQQSGETTGDQAKSGPSPADLKKERQILATNLQTQASQLKLQSVVMSAEPRALVNGNLVGEGDVVASFRVIKITARGMVIEREGIKLEVLLNRSATDAMP